MVVRTCCANSSIKFKNITCSIEEAHSASAATTAIPLCVVKFMVKSFLLKNRCLLSQTSEKCQYREGLCGHSNGGAAVVHISIAFLPNLVANYVPRRNECTLAACLGRGPTGPTIPPRKLPSLPRNNPSNDATWLEIVPAMRNANLLGSREV